MDIVERLQKMAAFKYATVIQDAVAEILRLREQLAAKERPPREPTPEMIAAFIKWYNADAAETLADEGVWVWKAMYDAGDIPVTQQGQQFDPALPQRPDAAAHGSDALRLAVSLTRAEIAAACQPTAGLPPTVAERRPK